MELVDFPAGMRGPAEDPAYAVVGPFCMVHNGQPELGMWLSLTDGQYRVWNGIRGYDFDDSYRVSPGNTQVIFYSQRWASKFVMRALTQADMAWLFPNDDEDMQLDDIRLDLLHGMSEIA